MDFKRVFFRPSDVVALALGFTAILSSSVFYLLFSFFATYPRNSLKGTQPKRAICSKVSVICKSISKI